MRLHDSVCNSIGTFFLILFIAAAPARTQSLSVTLSPGANVQAAVDAQPENTTFILKAGTYRLQSVQPKNGDTFVGQGNPILSGAQILSTFTRQGNLWVANGQTQHGQQAGYCDAQHPRCTFPEDLFFDSVPLLHVASMSAVVPGTWYFDYPNQRIVFADSPNGHLVETSVVRSAFSGSAGNVTISGLTVEKYAVPAQCGAIGDQNHGPNWTVNNTEIRWNHSGGLNLMNGSTGTLNYVHHNGQKGIGGTGTNILVQGNKVSFNNWAGFDCGWECGGMKFGQTVNLVIRGNSVHDNAGPGIWSDVDNMNTLYESNTVMNNTGGPGIQHEISYAAVIRYNSVCGNSVPGPTSWLWSSQIMIQNSQNVQVYGNQVETPFASFATGGGSLAGNGIGIIQQNRGSGIYGPRLSINNSIHNNNIVFRGVSTSGEVADYNESDMVQHGNNSFDYNTYHLVDPTWYHWDWGVSLTFAGLQKAGQETHGTVDALVPVAACSASAAQPTPSPRAATL